MSRFVGLLFLIFPPSVSGSQGFYPTFGQSCAESPHACFPADTLDCIWSESQSLCGQNHIWLHVDHNTFSMPLYGADTCDHRFADLDGAKYSCQQITNCTGVTMDYGKNCNGAVYKYSLRSGVLVDTWDTNYLSWQKKDFFLTKGYEMSQLFETDPTQRCKFRHQSMEEAVFACKMTFFCAGIAMDNGLPGCPEAKYELRQGGQVKNASSSVWIFQPVSFDLN